METSATLFYLSVFGFIVLAGLLFCASIVVGLTNIRSAWLRPERMPWVLRRSQLALNETELRDNFGGIHRVDQVFELYDGSFVIVDTKTRAKHRVYQSDVMQIQRYASVLRNLGHTVASFAFVRSVVLTRSGRSVRYIEVSI